MRSLSMQIPYFQNTSLVTLGAGFCLASEVPLAGANSGGATVPGFRIATWERCSDTEKLKGRPSFQMLK